MRIFRSIGFQRLLVMIGGIAFLNLGFVVTEFRLIAPGAKNALIDNLANTGFEEEKETDGETSSESSVKEVDLSISNYLHHVSHLVLVAQKSIQHYFDSALDRGFKEIFSPPPENLVA
jgi:hypothetical protein